MSLISGKRRIGRAAATATLAATGALISAGVMAAPAGAAVGYPTPGGIYAPFTDCPLTDPAMDNSLPGLATGVSRRSAIRGPSRSTGSRLRSRTR
jgi:hypothetical protein